MKQFLTTLFCLFILSASAQDKNFREFYKSHKKEADVSLNVPGFIANFFIDNQDDEELEALLKKSSNYKVLVYDNSSAFVQKDFKRFIKKNRFKTIVRIKDGKERINVHFKEVNNRIREIIVNVYNNDEDAVLLGLKTNLTTEELHLILEKSKVAYN